MSVASSFSYSLRQIWNDWDVRGMVLLSLLLQIALFIFGKCRKYGVNSICRMVLWLAYISADWVAIAALGKLSNSHAASPTSNVIRALWAPILILHLGGPDTITAYALEDTYIWKRHVFTLIVQTIFVVYVIYFSWTRSLLSLLSLPLIVAGIIKYVERILCLELTNSKKTEPILNNSAPFLPESSQFLESLDLDLKRVLLGYLLFLVMRPEANDYLSHSLYLISSKVRVQTYLKESTDRFSYQVELILQNLLESEELRDNNLFDIAAVELGFIFDILYTKAALVYTKKGCLLRLGSFLCSFLVLLLFLFHIMNKPSYHFSRVDIYITIIMLVGAVALEFFALFSMICSDWIVPIMLFHGNCLVRKILQYILKCFPCFVPQPKRQSGGKHGQFNLLEYHYRNSRKGKVYDFLEKHFSRDVLENWLRHRFTKFEKVPSSLKLENYYQRCLDSFFVDDCFEPTRGQKTLNKHNRQDLQSSIRLDFDTSIIAWHLATTICYHQDSDDNDDNGDRESCKYISDYMMYLLAMQPAMLLPEHCKCFWLDACHKLKDLLSEASDMKASCTLLLELATNDAAQSIISDNQPVKKQLQYASDVVQKLTAWNQNGDKWKMIKEMWIEMLLYAAHSCQQVHHLKQLAQGGEFLTLLWIMGDSQFIAKVTKSEDSDSVEIAFIP